MGPSFAGTRHLFHLAHCGGGLPTISGRLLLLGLEKWVPNPEKLTLAEMQTHLEAPLSRYRWDHAHRLAAALEMTTPAQIVYGSDCGVPCTTDAAMDMNLSALLAFSRFAPHPPSKPEPSP